MEEWIEGPKEDKDTIWILRDFQRLNHQPKNEQKLDVGPLHISSR